MFRNILAASDDSAGGLAAVAAAANLAQKFDAVLVVLHVYELPPFEDAMLSGAMINGVINLDPRMLDGWMDTVKLAVRQKIESVLTPLGAAYTYREERGRTAPVVAQVAKEIEANLIVVGSRGKGMVESFLLGSVSDRVAQIATCSVLIVR